MIGKKIETNNKTAPNILYVPYNSKDLRPLYVTKHNLKFK